MVGRQRSGSVVCPSCGKLVGVNEERCYSCGRRNPGLWGWTPVLRRLGQDLGFTTIVVGACVALYLVALLLDPAGIGGRGPMSMLSPSVKSLFLLGASGSLPLFELGRWWTPLSAALLHGGLLHLLFNVLWLRQLAPLTAEAYGPARMILIFTASSIAGFLVSSVVGRYLFFLPRFLSGAQFTVGASASIFGLLGALVYYGRRRGSSMIHSQMLTYAVILGVFGFIMPGVDNWAHLGGFAGGWGAARLLDPWKPERIDHLIAALVCLVAFALAVLISFLSGLPALR